MVVQLVGVGIRVLLEDYVRNSVVKLKASREVKRYVSRRCKMMVVKGQQQDKGML